MSDAALPAIAVRRPARPLDWGPRLLALLRFVALPLALLALWEAAARLGAIDARSFPPPSRIAAALDDLMQLNRLWPDITASLGRVAVGFTLAVLVGGGLGLLLGWFHGPARWVTPVVELLRPISVIAWIPIAILWFGLGNGAAWFLIFLGAFFPIFTSVAFGVRSLDPSLVRAARCLGAGPALFATRVLLPAALPHMLSGMRIGLGTAWTCVIAAELIAASSGLGYMIQLARTMLETDKVLGGMAVIGAIGFGMNAAMAALERRLTPWSPHSR